MDALVDALDAGADPRDGQSQVIKASQQVDSAGGEPPEHENPER